MSKRRKNRPNAKGRNPTTRFARLDHRMLESPAYRALTPTARALLVELVMLHNGENNGAIYLSVQDATDRIGLADPAATCNAFNELQDRGLIEMTKEAHFAVKSSKTSRARCWRLPWEAGPGRKMPSWDFLNHEPSPGTREHKRMERGLKALKRYKKGRDRGKMPVWDSITMDPMGQQIVIEPVEKSSTASTSSCGFASEFVMQESCIHTATPWVHHIDRPSNA